MKAKNIVLPVIAVIVVLAAVLSVVLPRLTAGKNAAAGTGATSVSASAADGAGISIDTGAIETTASFFDYDADGTTVELFAVRASDGTVRLALNTCQVCNGSPYAYFEQDGDGFVCQNCGNYFSSDEIGLSSAGCNPIPITDQDYTEQDGVITIPAAFLDAHAEQFTNWKQF